MQKIRIVNFQASKDIEIELHQALLLIGEQASGKSTISKLIYFFKSLKQDFIDLIYETLDMEDVNQFWFTDGRKAFEKRFRQNTFEKFYNFFGSTKHLPDFSVSFSYTPDWKLTLSLRPDKSLKQDYSSDFYTSLFYGEDIRTFAHRVKQFSEQKNAYERQAFQQATRDLELYVNQLFNDSRIPLFIPAGRNITVNYSDQFKLDFYGSLRDNLARQESSKLNVQSVDLYLMTIFLNHVERIKQQFRNGGFAGLIEQREMLGKPVSKAVLDLVINRIEQILKGEYRQDQYGEKLYYDQENYVYLNNASSGQQEAIRILQDIFLIVLENELVFRVIEEPEAHLYPMAQKHLIELIAIVLNQTDSQIILTTHSPYVLSVFNNLLFAQRIVRKSPEVLDQVAIILPQACWFNPDTTNVYFLKDGYCRSVFDKATGLIDQNSLDEISEELGADFAEMYDIYAKVSHG